MSKGFKYTLIASILWAICIVVLRLALNSGENVFSITFWTAIIVTPFWLYEVFRNKSEVKKLTKKDWIMLATTGCIGSIGIEIAENLAIKYSTPINYSFLIRTVILFTIVFAYLFLNEKITSKKVIVSLLILIGSYLFTTNGKIIALSVGDIYTITEAALIAFGNNVLGKLAVSKLNTDLSSSLSYVIGIVPLMFFPLIFRSMLLPNIWLYVIVLAGLYTLLRICRYKAYEVASASYVTMVFSFTPVFVTILSFIIPSLNVTMTPFQIVGGVFIILGGVAVEKLKI